MSGSPVDHAKREGWDKELVVGRIEQLTDNMPSNSTVLRHGVLRMNIAAKAIEAFDHRRAGRYVEESECNTEIYKAICEIKGEEPFLSNNVGSCE